MSYGIKESLDVVAFVKVLAVELKEAAHGDIFDKLKSLYDAAPAGLAAIQGAEQILLELKDLDKSESAQLLPEMFSAMVELVKALGAVSAKG